MTIIGRRICLAISLGFEFLFSGLFVLTFFMARISLEWRYFVGAGQAMLGFAVLFSGSFIFLIIFAFINPEKSSADKMTDKFIQIGIAAQNSYHDQHKLLSHSLQKEPESIKITHSHQLAYIIMSFGLFGFGILFFGVVARRWT